MLIKLHEIPIRDVINGYTDQGESGVYAYGGKLTCRPPYQRELIYSTAQMQAVIESIMSGFPLNVMYWMDNGDQYELLDGQQRTLSICKYVDGDFSVDISGSPKYYHNLTQQEQDQILDYKLMIYWCVGTDVERLAWFKTINIAGEKLTDQELRNAVYTGPWITAAKRLFSKSGCYGYNLGGSYVKGEPIRQELLETVLKWKAEDEGEASIESLMAKHQMDNDADALKKYFTNIIDWASKTFPTYNRLMKGLPWGHWYNVYKTRTYDGKANDKMVQKLLDDPEITKRSGVYEYVLTGDERALSLRVFDEPTKRKKYADQKGICPMCGKSFKYEEMAGDHIIPWSQGGKTTEDNCQMLCRKCNLLKSATAANFNVNTN